MSGDDFNPEQRRYLEGFVSGLQSARAARGLGPLGGAPGAGGGGEPVGPDAAHLKAQAATEKAGKKLVDQEKWKRAEHPFDAYARMKAQARDNVPPKPEDNFRWRYHGLFHVAPAQDSYMCRLRVPNGVMKHWQFAGVADLAERTGGPYCHVTTRANLQFREIPPANMIAVVEGVAELGLTARGSGADNIRNVTGGATAGIDRQELFDTRPLAKEWHNHILNDRSLYGLPRKFNVAFDGGGVIPTLEETNDIGFQAVTVLDGGGLEPGLWFRLILGGITGHKDLARDTGIVVRAEECTPVADAIVRVFIDNGDRTNRTKARMKYVLDAWGFDRYIAAVEDKLGRKLARVDAAQLAPRPPFDRAAHIGVHPQKQPGLNWIGVAMPVGKLTCDQMRALADIARDRGDGDIRLTVWQNLLISGVSDANVAVAKDAIVAAGLDWRASSIAAGLVACTGATGCKFAAAHTKENALEIAAHVDARLAVDQPVNIHLTGCHHSCAQHYIGDIGLIGAKVPINDDGDTVHGYDIVVGGGFADQAKIGRVLFEKVKADEAPGKVEGLLRAWMEHRADAGESFFAFANRHEADALKGMVAAAEAGA
jgi:ferredoxin-nitrite reductase